MILTIFILLLCICGFLAWYGYFTKIRMFSVVGLSILFLLSAWIILYSSTGQDTYGLQYKVGTTETYTYVCTACGTPSINVTECTGTPTTCDFYDGNELSCVLYGCIYDNQTGLCGGDGTPCVQYGTDFTTCARAGCDVTTTVINGTAGVNATVLNEVVSVDNYETYNDNTTFWVGFLLAVISATGLFLVAVNNVF